MKKMPCITYLMLFILTAFTFTLSTVSSITEPIVTPSPSTESDGDFTIQVFVLQVHAAGPHQPPKEASR